MKTPSTDLFTLIQSLTANEKAYFRKYARLHTSEGGRLYEELFDLVAAQDAYDDAAIKEHFKGQKVTNHLHKVKAYLQDLILRSLVSFHRGSNYTFEVEHTLAQIRVLFHKGLHTLCAKLVRKTKKLAAQCHDYASLEHLILWELRLMAVRSFEGVSAKDIEIKHQELEETMNCLNSSHAYMKEQLQAFHGHYTKGYTRQTGEEKRLDEIVSSEMFKSEDNAVGYWAKQCYLNILELYYGEKNDYNNSLKVSLKRKALFEDNPKVIASTDDRFYSYLQVLYNVMEAQFHLGQWGALTKSIDETRALSKNQYVHKVELLQVAVFYITTRWDLLARNQTGQFDAGIPVVSEIQEGLKKYRAYLNPREKVILLMVSSVNAFGRSDYDKALDFITEIINEPAFMEYQNVYSMAVILRIIIHYELGTYDILPSLMRSAVRYLNKLNRMYKLEAAILKFIKQQTRTVPVDWVESLAGISDELASLDAIERRALETFDLVTWIESKVQKKSFAETLQRKSLSVQI